MYFFKLNDLSPLINLNGRKAKFISENRSGFNQDLSEACEKLIQALKARNFNVPGFEIEFTFHPDEATVDVFTIENYDLDFRFVSDQQINIKGKELSIYSDNSGSLDVYVLDNWERDKKKFMRGKKFHLKMDGQERFCLHYNLRGPIFENTTDDREYQAEKEPKTYKRRNIEEEFNRAVLEIVKHVETFPAQKGIDVFIEPEHIPLTNPLFKDKVLYGFREMYSDKDPGIVPNLRLLSLGVALPEDHKLRSHMHDGFVYMEIRDPGQEPAKPEDTGQFNFSMSKQSVVIVNPKHYNCFYVIDATVFHKLKMEWFKENECEKRLTDQLFDEFKRKQAMTMVEINEYKGGYDVPVVITNRRIWENEVIPCALLQNS